MGEFSFFFEGVGDLAAGASDLGMLLSGLLVFSGVAFLGGLASAALLGEGSALLAVFGGILGEAAIEVGEALGGEDGLGGTASLAGVLGAGSFFSGDLGAGSFFSGVLGAGSFFSGDFGAVSFSLAGDLVSGVFAAWAFAGEGVSFAGDFTSASSFFLLLGDSVCFFSGVGFAGLEGAVAVGFGDGGVTVTFGGSEVGFADSFALGDSFVGLAGLSFSLAGEADASAGGVGVVAFGGVGEAADDGLDVRFTVFCMMTGATLAVVGLGGPTAGLPGDEAEAEVGGGVLGSALA